MGISRRNTSRAHITRPLAVVLYAAFTGLLLASYATPLREIFESRAHISALEKKIADTEAANARQERLIRELNTAEGIERVARERYGMILPGETVYIIPKDE